MKKFLALLLAALMVLAMFTACAKTATPSQEAVSYTHLTLPTT